MSDDEALTAAREFMRRAKTLRLWKEGDTQMIWCDQCQRSEPIDKHLLRRVKASRVCPMCYRESNGTSSVDLVAHRYVSDQLVEEEAYGYNVRFKWEKGKITVLSHEQCAYWNHGREYINGIIMTMSGYLGEWSDHNYWRFVGKQWGSYYMYYNGFYPLEDLIPDADHQIWDMMVYDKRSYYEYIAGDLGLKSNQVKLISEGLYSRTQIEYIKAFDLKKEKEVLKYSGYMKKYWVDGAKGFNVTTLDYLWRNKIRLSDYLDYAKDCRAIGRKLDKPKDFQHWHEQIANARKIQVNEKLSRQMEERCEHLKAYNYKGVMIKPIDGYAQLMEVGKTLHNCIRTYADRYANGVCDLYCVVSPDGIVGAIEVRDGQIKQARADRNQSLPRNIQRVVDRWELTLKGATDGQKVPRARSVQV